eukprot:7382289-Prymnesium_polylepis.2
MVAPCASEVAHGRLDWLRERLGSVDQHKRATPGGDGKLAKVRDEVPGGEQLDDHGARPHKGERDAV